MNQFSKADHAFLLPRADWVFIKLLDDKNHSKAVKKTRLCALKHAKLISDTWALEILICGFLTLPIRAGFQKLDIHISWLKNAHPLWEQFISFVKHMQEDYKKNKERQKNPYYSAFQISSIYMGNQWRQKSALMSPTQTLHWKGSRQRNNKIRGWQIIFTKNPSHIEINVVSKSNNYHYWLVVK